MAGLCRALLVSAVVAAGASPVLATEVKPSSEAYSWTGFDFGLQGGYGGSVERDNLSLASFQFPLLFPTTDRAVGDVTAHRAVGGAHIGYDQQYGAFVFGIRGELDATGLAGTTNRVTKFNLNGGANCQSGCQDYDTSLAFQDTRQAFLLGRSGYAFDRILIFAEGGVAFSNVSSGLQATQSTVPGNPARSPTLNGAWSGTGEHALTGGAIGLGAEYALTDHWRLGAEWRFADFAPAGYFADLVFSRDIYNRPVAYKVGFLENLGLLDASYRF